MTTVETSVATLATELLKKADATTSDLLTQIKHKAEIAVRPLSKLPKPTVFEIAEDQRAALAALLNEPAPKVPHVKRLLSSAEIGTFTDWLDHLRVAEKAVKTLRENTKGILHNHFDVKLENDGLVDDDTPFHPKEGWYAVEDKTSGQAPGHSQKIVREVSGGGVNVTVAHLKALRDTGKITNEQYNKFTEIVPVEVVNHTAIIAHIAREESFAQTLLDVAPPTAPTPSITLRPVS